MVLARLLTTTIFVPVTLPAAAEAVTRLGFEEDTDKLFNGPVKLLRD